MRLLGALTLLAIGVALAAPATSAAQASPATPRVILELEAGPAWQSYNDQQIPNNPSATRFSLSDLAGTGPFPAGRFYATWNVNERHGLRLLVAPFSLTETGVSDVAVNFAGETYAAGAPIEATYKFNSYRLSYRYRLRSSERATTWVGFSAKIRDALVELQQGATTSSKDDLGFVPLLHLAGEWRVAPRWRVNADFDGLAGGPGRAFDVAVKAGYDLSEPVTVNVGYRTVEGGADVPEVYSFAWLHYAVASVVWRW